MVCGQGNMNHVQNEITLTPTLIKDSRCRFLTALQVVFLVYKLLSLRFTHRDVQLQIFK